MLTRVADCLNRKEKDVSKHAVMQTTQYEMESYKGNLVKDVVEKIHKCTITIIVNPLTLGGFVSDATGTNIR